MGGSVAFYHQHPEYLGLLTHELRFSSRVRERLSLLACFLIVQHFQHRLAPWTDVALARRLGVPLETLLELLEEFEKASIVVAVSGGSDAYVPARDPASVTVKEVLEAARAAGESPTPVEWVDLMAAAEAAGKEYYAADARRQAERTEE